MMFLSRWTNTSFQADFVVLDVDDDVEVPLILGSAHIEGSHRYGQWKDENSLNFDDTCYYVDAIDELVDGYAQGIVHRDLFEECLEEGTAEEASAVKKELEGQLWAY